MNACMWEVCLYLCACANVAWPGLVPSTKQGLRLGQEHVAPDAISHQKETPTITTDCFLTLQDMVSFSVLGTAWTYEEGASPAFLSGSVVVLGCNWQS